jgi:quercetin dioxygenase-like cupin family protein
MSTPVVATAALLALLALSPADARAEEAKITPLLSRELGDIVGKEVLMLMAEYGPAGSTLPHRHNAHTFVYVLDGSVEMQVEGGEPVTLTAGQTFYEAPEDIHAVSRNASDQQPAKILVFFVKEKGAPPLVAVK